jgi:hypothetical protein
MDVFLKKHCPMANKNNPIIIDIGNNIDEQRFNTKLSKQSIENILSYVKCCNEYKIKINNIKGISEFYYGNYYFKHVKNTTEFSIINTNEKFQNSNIVIRSLDVKKDTFIPPSVSKYNSIFNYDLLTVTINNSIDLCVYDCIEYFKCQLVIKKPVPISTITTIINNISIN